MIRIDPVQVKDRITGNLLPELIGQEVQVVIRETTTPFPIYDETVALITDSLVAVTPNIATPTIWIDTTNPEDLYLDWYEASSGQRGPILFEEVLRDEGRLNKESSAASAVAAQGALAAAEALDSTRMQLAGAAVAQGMSCYGVWTAGAAPTPPNDGKIYWGLEIVP